MRHNEVLCRLGFLHCQICSEVLQLPLNDSEIFSPFYCRKTSTQLQIGHTKSIPCAASPCMGSQSATFLDRKLMLQDLFANYLMTWNQEYQYSSVGLVPSLILYHSSYSVQAVFLSTACFCLCIYFFSLFSLLMKHAIKLSAMKEMFDKPEFWPTFQGNCTG